MSSYILGIDQSTSGTKALLFDTSGHMVGRSDCAHKQIISPEGWISHDPMEIYHNVRRAAEQVLLKCCVPAEAIKAIGISNQRETALIWNRATGEPIANAVVWHCARGLAQADRIRDKEKEIRKRTGLQLSPYFSAAKIAWLKEHTAKHSDSSLCAGTMDSWLVYKLTGGASFKTDVSNAARTQLFHLDRLAWDEEICTWFGIAPDMLPEVCASDSIFGWTTLDGLLPKAVPIHGVLGDSNGALYGQGCEQPGMVKATYGTGSSVMLNTGDIPVFSDQGIATSIAWGVSGKVAYVLEGNINHTGAVIKWIKEELGLLSSAEEAGLVAQQANQKDTTYLVPAFTGLGAPYWNDEVRAMLFGMTRGTGRAEIVKAAEECIAYQITDIMRIMQEESGIQITELRVDGGPTRDAYLMQMQSDLLDTPVSVPEREELSAMGAAYLAGIAIGLYDQDITKRMQRKQFMPAMDASIREEKYKGWQKAVRTLLSSTNK